VADEYEKWKAAKGMAKQQAFADLLRSLEGAVQTAVGAYAAAPLPRVVLESQARRAAADAINEFNPASGMRLSSFLITRAKQDLHRYVGTYQNVARIPEFRINQIGKFREAQADLSNKFNREPSADELADHLGVSMKHVTALQKSLRPDLLESAIDFDEDGEADAEWERAMVAYYSLDGTEKLIFDYSLGAHGKPKLSPGEVAKKVGLDSVRYSQAKKRLAQKLKGYVSG
jgi:DNA-directed RNA polymerase specialized sigma subunit